MLKKKDGCSSHSHFILKGYMCCLPFKNEFEQEEIKTLLALIDYSYVVPRGKDGEKQSEG